MARKKTPRQVPNSIDDLLSDDFSPEPPKRQTVKPAEQQTAETAKKQNAKPIKRQTVKQTRRQDVETAKRSDGKKAKSKVTIYLDPYLSIDIDEMVIQAKRYTIDARYKATKSELIEACIRYAFSEIERKGAKSDVIKILSKQLDDK